MFSADAVDRAQLLAGQLFDRRGVFGDEDVPAAVVQVLLWLVSFSRRAALRSGWGSRSFLRRASKSASSCSSSLSPPSAGRQARAQARKMALMEVLRRADRCTHPASKTSQVAKSARVRFLLEGSSRPFQC